MCTQCCQCLRIIHSLHLRFSLTFIVLCLVPNVASDTGQINVRENRICPVMCPMLPVSQDNYWLHLVFSNVYLPCVLCTQCCQCLRIVYYCLHLRFSLTFICPVYCVPNVASVRRLSNWLHLRFSLTFRQCCQCLRTLLTTLGTQYTGQINVRENRRCNQ